VARLTVVKPWQETFTEWAEGKSELLDFKGAEIPERMEFILSQAGLVPRKPTLLDMQQETFEINDANGWFDSDRSFGEDIALLHSEVSEMFEAYRDHGFDDVTLANHNGRLSKPEGFGSECADVLIRILDTARRREAIFPWATLEEVQPSTVFDDIEEKPVGDQIAALHWMIATTDAMSPSVALSNALSFLVSWCRKGGIDLRAEYERKSAYNRTRGYKHGGKRV
jgi:hypothetical protein